ncbi:hypothetical protein QOZ80_6BG0459780 [Eleusine coracana subsp. coracana]|nr:hypothetical protein QOZ80_6BG0459780 [Eleusine coracana subsp. coracana]
MAAPTNLPLPCLVFDYGDIAQPTTVFSVADGAHHVCDADELRGKRSWPTSSGWVLTWDPATSATYLWNPSSAPGNENNRRVALPPMAHPPPAGSVCALSGSPTAGCTVVLSEPGESTVLWYCHVGDGATWTRHEYDIGTLSVPRFLAGTPPMKRFFVRVASWRGRFYYHRSETELGVIDFPTTAGGSPEFSVLTLAKPVPLRDPGPGSWLQASVYPVDVDGNLHLVYVVKHGPDLENVAYVGVYRMDSAGRNEFVKVESIGDRAVVTGNGSGAWCPATEFGLTSNCVYWMSPFDKRLHLFDIGAGTESVQDPCTGVAEPARHPFWVVPVHP